MYHTMVYTLEAGRPRSEGEPIHVCTIHLFTKEKLSTKESLKKAGGLIRKHFPSWILHLEVCYIGIEELPVEGPESYAIVFFEGKFTGDRENPLRRAFMRENVSTVPEELANAITQYRFSRITIDINEKEGRADGIIISALSKIGGQAFKTKRGYHIRVQLEKPLSFKELYKIRRKLHDDWGRLWMDKSYHTANLDFLTNAHFSEEYWFEYGEPNLYTERELSKKEIDELVAEYEYRLPKELRDIEPMVERREKYIIKVEKSRIVIVGHITEDEARQIYEKVVEELKSLRKDKKVEVREWMYQRAS
ncbi:MAG: hypothetical protein QXP84_07225 [Candidatus Korarchaeum sp.]